VGPDFLGIGAQRGGTTWLYEQLLRHPQVRFPIGKEVNYWNVWHGRGIAVDTYLRRFRRYEPDCRAGEISPEYAALDPPVIAEMRRSLPDLRLFLILRSPLERAWSDALMTLREACEMEPHEASDAWFLDVLRSRRLRRRGEYLAQLRSWHAGYPRDQLLLLFLEDVEARPREVLRALCRHIGVSEAPVDALAEADLRARVNAGGGPPPPERIRRHLLEQYERLVAELSDYLGRDLGHWLAPAAATAPDGRRSTR